MVIAFLAVQNPVVALAQVNTMFNSNIKANAVSEAHIAENIKSIYQPQNPLNQEEIAKIKLIEYKNVLDAEQKAKEQKELAENASKIEKLNKAGLTGTFINEYIKASRNYNVPWEVIAAVHYVETRQSGDTHISSYAGAQGPMQFMPSTFRAYAKDGDNDGIARIGNVKDAVQTAANYMAANGAANGNVVGALYRYNHDYSYVYHVLSIAKSIGYSK